MKYPLSRLLQDIDGEDQNITLRMRRLAWFLYRQSPALTLITYSATAGALGYWLLRVWSGDWSLDAYVIILAIAVLATTGALGNVRQGVELGLIAGGYGVAFWWIGGRLLPVLGAPFALIVAAIALLAAAAHHEEVLQETEPINPLRSATPDATSDPLDDIL